MVKLSATRQSAKNVLVDIRQTRKALNATWAVARRAPMFLKKPKPTAAGKKPVVRTNRLINSHAYKILASGAALNVAAATRHEAGVLRVGISGESKRAPLLPSVSAGAQHLVEDFLCAYAATALQKAVTIREGLGTSKRISPAAMRMAFEVVNEQVFRAAAPCAGILMAKPVKKRKARAKAPSAEAGKEAEAKEAEATAEAASADA